MSTGGMTELGFIFTSTIVFAFIVLAEGAYGTSGTINGFNPAISTTQPADWVTGFLTFVWNNITVFFGLMTVNSSIAVFNSVIMAAYGISMLYIILRLVRGGG